MASLPQPNPATDDRRSGRHRPGRVDNHGCNWPPPARAGAERTSNLRRPTRARRDVS
jgi:hypothetical protein